MNSLENGASITENLSLRTLVSPMGKRFRGTSVFVYYRSKIQQNSAQLYLYFSFEIPGVLRELG